jgi:hypothetical protein
MRYSCSAMVASRRQGMDETAITVAVFVNVVEIGRKIQRQAVKERYEAQPSTILSRCRCD